MKIPRISPPYPHSLLSGTSFQQAFWQDPCSLASLFPAVVPILTIYSKPASELISLSLNPVSSLSSSTNLRTIEVNYITFFSQEIFENVKVVQAEARGMAQYLSQLPRLQNDPNASWYSNYPGSHFVHYDYWTTILHT